MLCSIGREFVNNEREALSYTRLQEYGRSINDDAGAERRDDTTDHIIEMSSASALFKNDILRS